MNSIWIELYGFFCLSNKKFILPVSKIDLFVTIVDNWKLLTSVSSSLEPTWLNYDFLRTEECCSNVKTLVVYVDGEKPLFKTILETLSMLEKALKMLLNICDNANAAARLAWGQPSISK